MASTSPRKRLPRRSRPPSSGGWPTAFPNPGAWLTTTANRKAIDRIRRENKRDDKHKDAHLVYDDDPPEPAGVIDDDRLRLILTCCHPALAMQTRVALTLRVVTGLTVPEIDRAFLVRETAMERRITPREAKIQALFRPSAVLLSGAELFDGGRKVSEKSATRC